jgi:hypothetical protein
VDKEKKTVTIKDDVLIGKAGDRDLLGDLFLPPENDPKKTSHCSYSWRRMDGR